MLKHVPPGGTNLAQEMNKLKAVACPVGKRSLWLRQSSQISAPWWQTIPVFQRDNWLSKNACFSLQKPAFLDCREKSNFYLFSLFLIY